MCFTDLSSEYFSRTTGLRTDLVALVQFAAARGSDNAPEESREIELFWEMWRPRYTSLVEGSLPDFQDNPPVLDDDIEDAVLEELARLEREYRISYVPDADLLEEHLEAAVQYVHVGAASALRHRQRDGFTDDAIDTLQEVNRILHLLEIEYDRNRLSVSYDAEDPSSIVSQFGVRSLVLRELANVRYLDGKHQEALDMAFDSFVCADAIRDAVYVDREFLLEVFGEDGLAIEEKTRDAIRKCLPLQDPQQIVDCFEGLKRQDKSGDWRLVARQCSRLAQTIDEDLSESSVFDGNRQEIDWYGYWRRAQGWAEEHLGPQEYRDLRKADEEEASKDRLEGYFFGKSWRDVPQKAQERLVNVDRAWLDKSLGRDFGAVLNDLQVAAEVMCHFFIWEPLLKSKGDQRLLKILAKDRELRDESRFPTISNYAWVCKEQGFRKFIQDKGASCEEKRFLHQDLPDALRNLSGFRNPAQHNPEKRMRREEVEPLIQLFLGMGRPGVLRDLVEVGQKLVSK